MWCEFFFAVAWFSTVRGWNQQLSYLGPAGFQNWVVFFFFFLPVKRVNRVELNSFCLQHQQRLSEYFSHLSCYESSWNHLLSPKSRRATPDGRLNQILSHIRISTWDALELLISSLLMRAGRGKKPSSEEQQAPVRQPLSTLYPL